MLNVFTQARDYCPIVSNHEYLVTGKLMIRRMPPLNALKAFEAAARLLSFTNAAQELSVTQAAISHQIRTLEEYVGTSLFERSHQRLALTQSGKKLLPFLTQAFDLVADGYHNLDNQNQQLKLNIKAPSSFSVQWLMPKLAKYQEQFPKVAISLSAQDNDFDFFPQAFDVEIRYLFEPQDSSHKVLLFKEQIFPVCSPSLLQQGETLKSVEDFAKHNLLHINFYPEDWQMWFEHMGLKGADCDSGHRFDQSVLTLEAAVQGLGIAMGRTPIVDQKLASGALIAPFEDRLQSTGGYWLDIKADMQLRPHVEQFRDWLLESVS